MEPTFGEAIGLADNGFRIPGRLADAIASNASNLALDANAMATYFYPDGSPRKVGETMTNKAYARTLEALASQGQTHCTLVQLRKPLWQKQGKPWVMTQQNSYYPKFDDFAGFIELSGEKRDPICTTYRDRYYVCTMPPPSSGGIAVAQTLGILENFDMSLYPPKTLKMKVVCPMSWVCI